MVDSLQGLRPDGRFVAMGADAEPLSISLLDLIMKRIRVIGGQQTVPNTSTKPLISWRKGKSKR
jgi:dehydrogenase